MASLAAEQGERDAFFWLGCFLRDGVGCEKNVEKAKECFFRAANLGQDLLCFFVLSLFLSWSFCFVFAFCLVSLFCFLCFCLLFCFRLRFSCFCLTR